MSFFVRRSSVEAHLLIAEAGTHVEQADAMLERHQAEHDKFAVLKLALQAEQEKRFAQIQAGQDPMTGLLNRRGLQIEWDKLKKSYKKEVDHPPHPERRHQQTHPTLREGQHSAMLIDLDHFKKVNDVYGHDVGDSVLKRAAEVIKTHLRDSDIVSRFGGEEFAVILPRTDEEHASTAGKNLCAELIQDPELKSYVNDERDITASIGVTALDLAKTMDENFKAADRALYAAKRGYIGENNPGRNQVVTFSQVENAS